MQTEQGVGDIYLLVIIPSLKMQLGPTVDAPAESESGLSSLMWDASGGAIWRGLILKMCSGGGFSILVLH